jgi:hypothetical protein
MPEPTFIGEGTLLRKGDAKWVTLVKELSQYQNVLAGSALPQNNALRGDTSLILRKKFLAALSGVAYGS